MSEIVIINGTGTSGKDEVINIIKKYRRVFNYSTIDYIKNIMIHHFGWDGISKNDKDRYLMSELKRLATEYNDGPINFTKQYFNNMNIEKFDFIFIHCRECEEINKLNEYFKNSKRLLVHRSLTINFNNNSDIQVYDCEYDYIINNTGNLDYLEQLCINFINTIEQESD